MKFGLLFFDRQKKLLYEEASYYHHHHTISIQSVLLLSLFFLLQTSPRMTVCDNLISSGNSQQHQQQSSTIVYGRILETRYGKLKGVIRPAADSNRHLKSVETYFGIPYAMPPIGINRFSPTRTPAPWSGIRVFDKFSPVCPQKFPDISNETAAIEKMPKGRLHYLKRIQPFLMNQSEDCLYLNIYLPLRNSNEFENIKRPILVYIHGESYEWNAGNVYDGRVLSSYSDLIIVTLNYRLGLLGFLNTNSSPYQKARVANYGLMDQIAALHWIQQNIEVFGGDPTNVTLMGHGTGAACINFLMISPAVVPGLFHRTILLSGSALSTWALIQDPLSYSLEVARQVNCTTADTTAENYEHIIDCLRYVPLNVLMKTTVRAPTFLSSFGPSVDGVVVKTNYQEDILTKYLSDLQGYNAASLSLGTAEVRDSKLLSGSGWYDMLLGVVTSEALWKFSANDIQSGFEIDRRDRILRTYVRNSYDYHLSEIFLTIVNEYTDWERTTLHPINIRDATISAISDAQFVAPLVQVGDLLTSLSTTSSSSSESTKKTFFYVFDYQTKDGDYPQRMGTVHGEELPYAFGAPLTDALNHFPHNFTKFETSLSEAFMSYIANFVRFGNPNDIPKQEGMQSTSKERNRFKNTVWEQYDPVHQKYLEIGTKAKLKNHFRAHQLSVWLRLIPELHRAGMQDVISKHNLFSNHDNVDLYEGLVRSDPLNRIDSLREDIKKYFGSQNGTVAEIIHSITTLQPYLSSACINAQTPSNKGGTGSNVYIYGINDSASSASDGNFKSNHRGGAGSGGSGGDNKSSNHYNATLGLTVTIGCALLVLNVAIFIAVYYQRAKTRMELKTLREQQQQMHSCSNSPFGSQQKFEKFKRHYDAAASTIVDVEEHDLTGNTSAADSSSVMYAGCAAAAAGATLPRHISSQTSFDYPNFATMPRYYNNPTKSAAHINGSSDIIDADNKTIQQQHHHHHHYRQPRSVTATADNLLSPPNGSVIMTSSLPKPPPPPKSNPPSESQPLLHSTSGNSSNVGGHHCQSNSVSAKPGILKVPAAAINEMRV